MKEAANGWIEPPRCLCLLPMPIAKVSCEFVCSLRILLNTILQKVTTDLLGLALDIKPFVLPCLGLKPHAYIFVFYLVVFGGS